MMYVNFVTRALTISGSTDSRGDIERGVRERRRKGKGGGCKALLENVYKSLGSVHSVIPMVDVNFVTHALTISGSTDRGG